MSSKPWDQSTYTQLTSNVLTKVGVGLTVGAAGVLLFKSPRLRTLWLGASVGAGAGYAWHQNTVFLATGDPNELVNPSLRKFIDSVRDKLPSSVLIKKE
jgi:hypothetical protein